MAKRIISVLFLWVAVLFFVTGCAVSGLGPMILDDPGMAGRIRPLLDERVESAVLDAPTAVVHESRVMIPTYPYEEYQIPAIDARYEWPYLRFDRERFLADAPLPEERSYRLITLENEYLQVLILPELGGRVWQVIHKASDNRMFYQNPVVKPSPWGPPQQLGWFALGGLEWNLPVNEHGYDWGTTWAANTFIDDSGVVGVTLHTPEDGRLLDVAITVSLRPGVAGVDFAHRIRNRSEGALDFDYWQTAMLAPGPKNQPGEGLRFVLPNTLMALHSSGDPLLPGPQQRFTWPMYLGRDMSQLGQWQEYLGFFEYPAAQGPFVGVYDTVADAGAVRVFPADVMRGSKVFGLGWHNALPSDYYSDDGSAYVELHGGLSPSFFEKAHLAGKSVLAWQETWYPVQGIGDLSYANERAAISLVNIGAGLRVGMYVVEPVEGELIYSVGDDEIVRSAVQLGPNVPYSELLFGEVFARGWSDDETLTIVFMDKADEILLSYTMGR